MCGFLPQRGELRRAEELGCDFALLSPVLPTLSHPGAPHLGWEGFATIAAGLIHPGVCAGRFDARRYADRMAARRTWRGVIASGLVIRPG